MFSHIPSIENAAFIFFSDPLRIMRAAARIRGMFFCTIYRKGKRHTLFSSDWAYLRKRVGQELRKVPGSKWGMVKKDDKVLINRVRHTMLSYPLEEPK